MRIFYIQFYEGVSMARNQFEYKKKLPMRILESNGGFYYSGMELAQVTPPRDRITCPLSTFSHRFSFLINQSIAYFLMITVVLIRHHVY